MYASISNWSLFPSVEVEMLIISEIPSPLTSPVIKPAASRLLPLLKYRPVAVIGVLDAEGR